MHCGSNKAQILREERQPAQRLAERVKQVVLRAIHPATANRGGVARRNFPELFEPAKMIEPDVIAISRGPSQALNPPLITPRLHHVPAIQRVSPALSRLAKEIRRNSGHYLRIKISIQPK